ncbi:MAG: cytochrome c oxidase subunit II [Deltaproteobacteria bacterium]|nr:cytochrome c oxidase subunit II [bacterium]MCB9475357.1 cytochrome c oxidase subunit II [Deltaproteobacteria bacterium]MCB9478435.1 cytochrome c oxidase subunit II [Deltaproteobacteria bacterium]MCB9489934.1 cytochrome c oxidase subunit II [Deltaproteobacteria bacterium]
MPPAASTFASNIDNLFYFIYWLAVIFFVLIIGTMAYFAIKYRRKDPNQRTSPIHGNHALELAWSAIPGVLLIAVFVWGFRAYMDMSVAPKDAMDIRVKAQMWNWSFDYPSAGVNTTELVVPAGRPVKLTMSSKDVLHSFFVPDFRVKKDVLPNRYTTIWFEAIAPGEHQIFCTEYCGQNHSKMLSKVIVKSQEDFDKWIEGQGKLDESIPLSEHGKRIFTERGCTACHTMTGQAGAGPSLKGKYGSQENLADGSQVLVDDNYIRESIMDPTAKVVAGFQPVMPTFKGQLRDDEVDALIEYIKEHGGQ